MKYIKYTSGCKEALYKTGLIKLAGPKKEFAPGIPDRKVIQKLPDIKKPQDWTFALQHHKADRAGEHLDLRLVDPDTGYAHSWALPAAVIPEPGKSVLAVPQPTHTKEYATQFGKGKPKEIESGYGKGTVSLRDLHDAEVFHSKKEEDGTRMRFNIYRGTHPEEFALVRVSDGNDRLVNKTLSRGRLSHLPLGGKPAIKERHPKNIDLENSDEVMMPKLDGAHTLLDLKSKGRIPRLFSYRLGKRAKSGVIEHTHKAPSLLEQRVPEHLARTVLRAETIGVRRNGKAIASKDLTGLLNSSVPVSRRKQKEMGVEVKPVLFDIDQYRGKPVKDLPYLERHSILKEIGEALNLDVVDIARTPGEKTRLLHKIEQGKHPLTSEGVILRPLSAPNKIYKAKFRPDHDVYVRGVYTAMDKSGKPKDRAGGFEYSWTPTGAIAGRVGTGFSHSLAKDMLSNPADYVGRVAKVQAETRYESGALGKPSFQEWHLDKGTQFIRRKLR